MQIYQLILTRRLDLVIIYKNKKEFVRQLILLSQLFKQNEKIDKYWDLARELKSWQTWRGRCY